MTIGRLAAMVLLALAAVGCGAQQKVVIDHGTPKLLAVSVHDASSQKDYAAMADAMDPEFRGAFRTMLNATRDYVRSLDALAEQTEKNIGPQQAQRFRRQAQRVYADTMPSPFDGAIENGQVMWSRVAIFEEGDVTAVAVQGKKTDFDRQFFLHRVKSQWYIAPRQPDVPADQRRKSFDRESKLTAETVAKYVKMTDDLAKKVRNHTINAGNIEEKMAALAGTVEPLPMPPTPSTVPAKP